MVLFCFFGGGAVSFGEGTGGAARWERSSGARPFVVWGWFVGWEKPGLSMGTAGGRLFIISFHLLNNRVPLLGSALPPWAMEGLADWALLPPSNQGKGADC